jgi:hypothetical protein
MTEPSATFTEMLNTKQTWEFMVKLKNYSACSKILVLDAYYVAEGVIVGT